MKVLAFNFSFPNQLSFSLITLHKNVPSKVVSQRNSVAIKMLLMGSTDNSDTDSNSAQFTQILWRFSESPILHFIAILTGLVWSGI